MKIRLILTSVVLAIFSIGVSAQCINGVKSYPIYEDGGEYVKFIDSLGMEIVRIEYDLIFSTKDSYRELYEDWEYLFVGFVDGGVKDFCLTLYEFDALNQMWFPVAYSEPAENGLTTMIYQPVETKNYKVEVKVKEFYEGFTAARYGLIYVHE